MKRVRLDVFLFMLALPGALLAQLPRGHSPFPFPAFGAAAGPVAGAGGQVAYSAEQRTAFTRLTPGLTVSLLGIGAQLGTDLGPRLDVRLFGNYTNMTHRYVQSGFNIALNVQLANTGARADFYPFYRFPFRISPGYLYLNQNRVAANLQGRPGATFTLNNVTYSSDNADPVHGTGRLLLGGGGFTVTAGMGRIISHTRKRFTYPFEAGVVFINTPVAQFNLSGQVCSSNQTECQPAAQFPTFAANLSAQVTSWNRRVAPFHIYPILEGGVAYSFNFRRRGLE